MGITIKAKNAKHTFDMGYGGFFNLRKNIALALDEEFGKQYSKLINCFNDKTYIKNVIISECIIKEKHLGKNYGDVLEFLYMSDVEGKIDYRTCRKILELLEKRISKLKRKTFTYVGYEDYERFIEFLKDCVRYHKNMRWS